MAETEAVPKTEENTVDLNSTADQSSEINLEYDFENYPEIFFENFSNTKDQKIFNNGSLVCISAEKRVRFPCCISALSIRIPKLNQEFHKAKKRMLETGFLNASIDLQLPDFRQENTSSAETALRIIFQYVFHGHFNVSPMAIKNVAVLAAYLEIDPILEALPTAAENLDISHFDIEVYKKIASGLGEMSVVGLEKFTNVFGGQKRNKPAQKRTAANTATPQEAKKESPQPKKQRPSEEPVPDENSFVIRDSMAEEDKEEEKMETTAGEIPGLEEPKEEAKEEEKPEEKKEEEAAAAAEE